MQKLSLQPTFLVWWNMQIQSFFCKWLFWLILSLRKNREKMPGWKLSLIGGFKGLLPYRHTSSMMALPLICLEICGGFFSLSTSDIHIEPWWPCWGWWSSTLCSSSTPAPTALRHSYLFDLCVASHPMWCWFTPPLSAYQNVSNFIWHN